MKTAPKQSYRQLQTAFAELLRDLAEETHARYCRRLDDPLYLAGKRRPNGVWDVVRVANCPELNLSEQVPIYPVPLPRHLTREQLADVLRDILKSEPLYLFADA